jgi:hypothetical protein
MVELNKRWSRETRSDVKGEWWLVAPYHGRAPNRAYISWPDHQGTCALYIWYDEHRADPWVLHAESQDLKALKAIGRIEAARVLNV